jgi:hypothetical protein
MRRSSKGLRRFLNTQTRLHAKDGVLIRDGNA